VTPNSEDEMREELARCRDEIAQLDREMIALLQRRVELALRTGPLKRNLGLPILDPAREATVIRSAVESARTRGLAEEPVREIFWRILAMSRDAQSEEK
jgi:chorismate mutase/prephenate dehydrogenase